LAENSASGLRAFPHEEMEMRTRSGEHRAIPSGPSGNVLVIEDDLDTGNLIVLMLATAGYGVRLVSNRDEAVLAMARYLYDYIVMDYHMPGLTAEAFVRQANMQRPKAKIILMTADDTVEEVAKRLKISAWIAKPFYPEDLVAVMQSTRPLSTPKPRLSLSESDHRIA